MTEKELEKLNEISSTPSTEQKTLVDLNLIEQMRAEGEVALQRRQEKANKAAIQH